MKPLIRKALRLTERGACYLLALTFACIIHTFAKLNRLLEEDT